MLKSRTLHSLSFQLACFGSQEVMNNFSWQGNSLIRSLLQNRTHDKKEETSLKKIFSKLDKSSMYLIGLTDSSKGVKPTSRDPTKKKIVFK